MAILDEEARDRILIEVARLVTEIAKAIQPLIPHEKPGLFGGEVHTPTRRQTIDRVVVDAESLLASFPEASKSLEESHRAGFQTGGTK